MGRFKLPGFLLILIGIGLFFFINALSASTSICEGFGFINPLCWFAIITKIIASTVAIIIALAFIIPGIILLIIETEEQLKAFGLFIGFVFLTVASLLLPDPLPLVDEIILPFVTAALGIRTLTK